MVKGLSGLGFLAVVRLSRPAAWAATAAPFAAGYIIALQSWHWALLLGILYFTFSYNLLMRGTGLLFDKSSHTPAQKGRLWLIVWAANIPFWIYLLAQGGWAANIWLTLMIVFVMALSAPGLRVKSVPFLDAFAMAFYYGSPFVLGILLGGGAEMWLPAFVAFLVWAMAAYGLGTIYTAHDGAGTAGLLGPEKTLAFCLAAFAVAAVLPTLYYGWPGVFVSILLLWYFVITCTLIPFRALGGHSVFRKVGRVLMAVNYTCGILLAGYLILLSWLS